MATIFGSEFERAVFGTCNEEYKKPYRLSRERSYTQVIKMAWRNLALVQKGKLKEGKYWYDPTSPHEHYEARILWQEVKNYLPRRVEGVISAPLHLYIAIGHSLDAYHGRDAFFWWNGVSVSIDISLRWKLREEVRADFLVGPEHFSGVGLATMAKAISDLLQKRRRARRIEERPKKSRTPKWELELTK